MRRGREREREREREGGREGEKEWSLHEFGSPSMFYPTIMTHCLQPRKIYEVITTRMRFNVYSGKRGARDIAFHDQ